MSTPESIELEEVTIPEEERLEFIADLKESRSAYKERNYTKSFDILLHVMLRLERLGCNFNYVTKIEDPDTGEQQFIHIRQRFYDLMRGDILDDERIKNGYFKNVSAYENDVWNFLSLEMIGEPELLSIDPLVKVVHIKTGNILPMGDWYKVWNYLIRQLDIVAPRMERKILDYITQKGMET